MIYMGGLVCLQHAWLLKPSWVPTSEFALFRLMGYDQGFGNIRNTRFPGFCLHLAGLGSQGDVLIQVVSAVSMNEAKV